MEDETAETIKEETPLDAFRRSAAFQIMFVLHSGLEVGKAIDHLCAAAERMSAALREWQPIATAPKDGTPVLLVWHWDSGIHRGISVVLADWACATHSHLSRHRNCPNEADCDMRWGAYAGEFSHWMPLPEPPQRQLTPPQ